MSLLQQQDIKDHKTLMAYLAQYQNEMQGSPLAIGVTRDAMQQIARDVAAPTGKGFFLMYINGIMIVDTGIVY